MRDSKRWGLAVFLVAAVTVAAVGVTTASGAKSAGQIKLAYVADLSGQMAPFDNPALAAAKLEIKKINAKGGVLGKQLVLLQCDTQNSKADVSKSCVDNLVGQGAVIGLVTCDVDFATAAIQVFLNKGLLTISPCIGTDQMGPKRFGAKGKLAFCYGNVAQDEGAAMAEYAYNVKHWRTAITITDNVIVYFKNIVQAFTSRYKQLGGKIVGAESFTAGDKTISTVVSRVNQKKAAAIVTSDGFADWSTEFAGIRSLGNNTPIMNSWAGDGTFWYPKGQKVSNYWYPTYASRVRRRSEPRRQGTDLGVEGGQAAARDRRVRDGRRSDRRHRRGDHPREGQHQRRRLAGIMQKFKGLPTVSGKVSFSPKLHSVFGRAYRIIRVQNSKPRFLQPYTAKKLGSLERN